MMKRNDWVVTYSIECGCGTMIMEFYRGTQAECIRIRNYSSVGESDDRRPVERVTIGTAKSWDEFLSAVAPGENIPAVLVEMR